MLAKKDPVAFVAGTESVPPPPTGAPWVYVNVVLTASQAFVPVLDMVLSFRFLLHIIIAFCILVRTVSWRPCQCRAHSITGIRTCAGHDTLSLLPFIHLLIQRMLAFFSLMRTMSWRPCQHSAHSVTDVRICAGHGAFCFLWGRV